MRARDLIEGYIYKDRDGDLCEYRGFTKNEHMFAWKIINGRAVKNSKTIFSIPETYIDSSLQLEYYATANKEIEEALHE
jgi:hypothetical protein